MNLSQNQTTGSKKQSQNVYKHYLEGVKVIENTLNSNNQAARYGVSQKSGGNQPFNTISSSQHGHSLSVQSQIQDQTQLNLGNVQSNVNKSVNMKMIGGGGNNNKLHHVRSLTQHSVEHP